MPPQECSASLISRASHDLEEVRALFELAVETGMSVREAKDATTIDSDSDVEERLSSCYGKDDEL